MKFTDAKLRLQTKMIVLTFLLAFDLPPVASAHELPYQKDTVLPVYIQGNGAINTAAWDLYREVTKQMASGWTIISESKVEPVIQDDQMLSCLNKNANTHSCDYKQLQTILETNVVDIAIIVACTPEASAPLAKVTSCQIARYERSRKTVTAVAAKSFAAPMADVSPWALPLIQRLRDGLENATYQNNKEALEKMNHENLEAPKVQNRLNVGTGLQTTAYHLLPSPFAQIELAADKAFLSASFGLRNDNSILAKQVGIQLGQHYSATDVYEFGWALKWRYSEVGFKDSDLQPIKNSSYGAAAHFGRYVSDRTLLTAAVGYLFSQNGDDISPWYGSVGLKWLLLTL
jgi:hypothetical protein